MIKVALDRFNPDRQLGAIMVSGRNGYMVERWNESMAEQKADIRTFETEQQYKKWLAGRAK